MRFDRRVRRFPRCLPTEHSRARAYDLRTRLSVRVARASGRGAAGLARAHLRATTVVGLLCSACDSTVNGLYLQCLPEEDLNQWPDERVWSELQARLGQRVNGPVLQKSVTPMRSFVAEPMSSGRLFLAGDAAHIVPPTGAKGMNLAIADVQILGQALESYYRSGNTEALRAYSATCLRRVWKLSVFRGG